MTSGRVLGIDYGEKRIGIALSDPLRTVATPLETVDGAEPKAAFRRLRELLVSHAVREVVIGHPLHLDGGRGDLAKAAEAFAAKLRAQVPGLQVHLWDERLSTAQAERVLRDAAARPERRRELRDQLAAVLILQSWLDASAPPLPTDDDWEFDS